MSNRKTDIRNWIIQEMKAIIIAGHYSGPQSVLVGWFRPDNGLLYIKPGISPLPNIEEITDALNKLITEKKLHFDCLQAIEEKINIRLEIP